MTIPRFPRTLLAGLAAALLAQPAAAAVAARCQAVAEQSMFELAALKSELMVLATGCQRGADYNAFVNRYRAQLIDIDRNLTAHINRKHGARGQAEADRFITDLANEQSTSATRLGSDYCPRNGMIFAEVMALPSAAELPAYAAGKNLIPAALQHCGTQAATPARAAPPAQPARRASSAATQPRR